MTNTNRVLIGRSAGPGTLHAASFFHARARYWIGNFGWTGDAFSPAIAIPSITKRAIS